MSRALIPTGGNDKIMTPDYLADDIVRHFYPISYAIEPCAGDGAFIRAFQKHNINYRWCEIDKGISFF